MTSVMARDIFGPSFLNELQTKVNFDNVKESENKKPEIVVSGSEDKTGSLVDKPQLNGNHYTPIIAEPLNFRKEIGGSVSEEIVERFIKIPRELFEDPNWKGMRLKYQRLFLIILENASYTQRVYKHNGNTITVAPGQFCVSFRRLADIFNQDVKWKDERIDAPLVQRAVSVFSKFGFSIHESIHGIMRLTITQRELCAHFKKQTDTPSDTQPIQNRYTNEERKEGKELKETIDGANALDSSLLNNKKEEQKKGPSVFTPQAKPQNLSEEKQKHFAYLWKFIVENSMCEGKTSNGKPGIKEKDLMSWITKYEGKEILECLKMTLKVQPSKTWPGYVVSLFKKNVVTKKDNVQINDEFLNEIMKTHKCDHLENTKQYVTDNLKHTDYQKNTDPKLFKEMIMRSMQMASTYDQIEPEYRQESEYEDDY